MMSPQLTGMVNGSQGVGRKEKRNVSAGFVASDTETHNSTLA